MPIKEVQTNIIVGALLLLFFVVSGSRGISCFQCNSAIDQNCEVLRSNETYSKYYKPCEQHADLGNEQGKEPKVFFCRKIEQHIKDMKETVRIIRKCGWEKSPKTDCYKFEDDDHKEVVCQCFTDACNFANSIVVPRTHLLIVLCVLMSVQRFFLV